jgi:hypothetical protein
MHFPHTLGPAASELQSAVSQVDSASNYIEEEQELEDEEEGPPPDEAPMSYADAVKHANGQQNQVIQIPEQN